MWGGRGQVLGGGRGTGVTVGVSPPPARGRPPRGASPPLEDFTGRLRLERRRAARACCGPRGALPPPCLARAPHRPVSPFASGLLSDHFVTSCVSLLKKRAEQTWAGCLWSCRGGGCSRPVGVWNVSPSQSAADLTGPVLRGAGGPGRGHRGQQLPAGPHGHPPAPEPRSCPDSGDPAAGTLTDGPVSSAEGTQ